MLIGGDDISSEVIYLSLVFLNVCLHLRSFPLRADWWKSDHSVDREPPTLPPECLGELAHRLKEGESTRPNSLPTWDLMVNNDA